MTTAEDLTQETFIEVIRHPDTFDGRDDPVPWLIGIARHRLLAMLRRQRQDTARATATIAEIQLSGGDDPAWRGAELRGDILGALDRIPTDQRAALLLRFIDGLSIKEVANAIGRTEDATESLIRRARVTFERAYGRGVDV